MPRKKELTPKERRAASRYRYEKNAYRKFLLRVRYDGRDDITFDQIERAAKRERLSINAFILQCVRECL
jgi:hypothetical protein